MRLGDFVNDAKGRVLGFVAGVGFPTGQTWVLDDPDCGLPHEDDLFELEGTVDDRGYWQWDGKGNPTDWRGNTIYRVEAWGGTEEEVEAALEAQS